MAKMISENTVNEAVKKLALPNFILKSAERHYKIFKNAVSLYHRRRFFSGTKEVPIDQLPDAEREEINAINNQKNVRMKSLLGEIKKSLNIIFSHYKFYDNTNPDRTEIAKIMNTEISEKIKQLNIEPLKDLYDDTFEGIPIPKPRATAHSTVPQNVIKKCKQQTKIIHAAIAEYAKIKPQTTKLIKVTKENRWAILKNEVKNSIGYIFAAERYYKGTVGYLKLREIQNSVKLTIDGLTKKHNYPKEKKGETNLESLFPEEESLGEFLQPSLWLDKPGEPDKVSALYFDVDVDVVDAGGNAVASIPAPGKDGSYRNSYTEFLNKCLEQYNNHYNAVKQSKSVYYGANTKGNVNTEFEDTIKIIKELENQLKECEEKLNALVKKNPRQAAALKMPISTFGKRFEKFGPAAALFREKQIKNLRHEGKYGKEYLEIHELDYRTDYCVFAVKNLINVCSTSTFSTNKLQGAKEKIDRSFLYLNKPYIPPPQESSKLRGLKEIKKDLSKNLSDIMGDVYTSKKTLVNLTAAIDAYNKETSTAKKLLRMAKLALIIAGAATGMAKITATMNNATGVMQYGALVDMPGVYALLGRFRDGGGA